MCIRDSLKRNKLGKTLVLFLICFKLKISKPTSTPVLFLFIEGGSLYGVSWSRVENGIIKVEDQKLLSSVASEHFLKYGFLVFTDL